MLVLSRKVGERIHIGENIVVEIRRIAGNRVTLALAAPPDVRILRGELRAAACEFELPAAAREEMADLEGERPLTLVSRSTPDPAMEPDCVI